MSKKILLYYYSRILHQKIIEYSMSEEQIYFRILTHDNGNIFPLTNI